MVSGIWTSSEFKANSQAKTFLGKEISKRSELLKQIEDALDHLHSQPEYQALQNLFFVEEACRTWLEAHPNTSSTPIKGMKTSHRRKGIERLQAQIKTKRQQLYEISDRDLHKRTLVTSKYQKSDVQLGVGPDGKDPRHMKSRAAFHQELLEKTIERARRLGHTEADFNTEQLGFLAAKATLKIDSVIDEKNRSKCKVEAMRVLCAMLGKNRTLAQQFNTAGIEVIVVPADRAMTDLPEFASLKDVDISQESGTPRTWNPTRGVGGLTVNVGGVQKMYVAVTEENLLGTNVAPTVAAIGGGCYAARYSTTSHEFAHGLHIGGALTPEQKATIARCFKARKRVRIDGPNRIIIDDATLVPSQQALNAVFAKEWADGPRRRSTPLPTPRQYYIWKGSGYVMKPNGTHATYAATHELQDCYSAFDDREYFAQLVNAYLGANGGSDPYTGRPRNNGDAWVRANESAEMVQLLDELFSAGPSAHFGKAQLEDTNVAEDQTDAVTVADYIRRRVQKAKFDKTIVGQLMPGLMAQRRSAMGYDDDE